MDFEKYTERSRGFIQSAQTLALREGHQKFSPEHVLKVLLDDDEGLASGLIKAAGRTQVKFCVTRMVETVPSVVLGTSLPRALPFARSEPHYTMMSRESGARSSADKRVGN